MTKARILLVDNQPDLVKAVSKRLEIEGYEVLAAKDGEEGLETARLEQPDLIILDLMLPKLSGLEVCKLLKHDSHCQKIPIVMLTARVQSKDEKLSLEAGADAYVRKPFEAHELLEQIRALLTAGR